MIWSLFIASFFGLFSVANTENAEINSPETHTSSELWRVINAPQFEVQARSIGETDISNIDVSILKTVHLDVDVGLLEDLLLQLLEDLIQSGNLSERHLIDELLLS